MQPAASHLLSHLEAQKESLQKCIRIFLFLSTKVPYGYTASLGIISETWYFFLSFFFFNMGGVGMSTCPQRLKRGVSDTVELELQTWWMLRCGL